MGGLMKTLVFAAVLTAWIVMMGLAFASLRGSVALGYWSDVTAANGGSE